MPPELEPVECPEEVKYLWDHFRKLNRRRRKDFNGDPEPISYLEVKAWSDRYRVCLSAWEMEALDAIDLLWTTKELPFKLPDDEEEDGC